MAISYHATSTAWSELSAALTSLGFRAATPLQKSLDGACAMVVESNAGFVLLGLDSHQTSLEVEIWGREQQAIAGWLETVVSSPGLQHVN